MSKNQTAQRGRSATIDTERLPTPEELYRAAVMVEEAAVILGILSVSDTSRHEDGIFSFFSNVLETVSETLTTGLDEVGGTFSRLADIKKGA